MTNFERLIVIGKTNMEMLADQIASYCDCGNCPIKGECHNDHDVYGCGETWLRWLQSEEKKGTKSIHETYADLECGCDFLSEYINAFLIKPPKSESGMQDTKTEIEKLCKWVIGNVEHLQKMLIERLGEEE